MNNENEINKSNTDPIKKNKIDISGNSEDIEFMYLKENHENKSVNSIKYNKINQNLSESNNKNKNEEKLEKEINNNEEIVNINNDLDDVNNNEQNLNKEIIKQDKISCYELDDLIPNENKEKKSIDNNIQKEEKEEIKNDNNKENKLNKNMNIIDNKRQEKNEKIIIPNIIGEIQKIKNIELNKPNNNKHIKKEEEKETKDENKTNSINKNIIANMINIDPANYNPRQIEIKEEKVIKENSKDNLKENSEERIISSKSIVKKSYTLDELGLISSAKIHRDANRILKQINKFNENTKFCPCCCLPCPTPGVLEKFSYCDNTDDFIETGQGTSLYFFFFKYSMIIMAATAIIIGIPFLIFSYQYTYSLRKLCNNYYNNRNNELINLMGNCELCVI